MNNLKLLRAQYHLVIRHAIKDNRKEALDAINNYVTELEKTIELLQPKADTMDALVETGVENWSCYELALQIVELHKKLKEK